MAEPHDGLAKAAPAPGAWVARRGAATGAAETRLREQDVLAAIERLPSLPTVVLNVMQAVRSETSKVSDIEEHLRHDLVLSAKLLKMANSPFFALPSPVGNIKQAVQVLGFNSLKSLVVASATSDLFAIDVSPYGYTASGLWSNSFAVATFARRLARIRGAGADEAEDLFVGGLLRDLGMVVLAPFLVKAAGRFGSGGAPLIERERAAVGFHHVWVVQQLAQRWRLPPALSGILCGHHDEMASLRKEKGLATVVLAERIAAVQRIGLNEDHPFGSDLESALVTAAGLDLTQLRDFMDEVPELKKQAQMDAPT